MLIKAIFLVATALACTESYKILGIFPLAGVSHYILASKLMKGLSEAGHDITMVSPYALKELPKNGTFTDVVLDGVAEDFQNTLKHANLFESDTDGHIAKLNMISDIFIKITNDTLHHPKVKQLVDSNQKFDAVVMEQFFNDAHKVYAHIFDCPLILLSSIGPNSMVNPTVGNPQPVSYVPHLSATGGFSKNLSFYNRAINMFTYVIEYIFIHLFVHPKQDKIMHDIYPNSPALSELYNDVSLVLLNSHISLNRAVPMVPNMVEIGGYFIDPPQKLPPDLQKYMDNAPEGVIYFSMGSNLKSKDMPEEKKRAILSVLGKLKQKVIWKFEEDLPGKPANVMIRKWCPQQDILAHPNIKLFITHGGLLSTTEAIYHGVPILAIPVFADQPLNAARAEEDGYGLKLPFLDPNFDEETLSSLINELLTNPKYTETAKRKASLYHDRVMKPMEAAVYWVEYVIKHKGAPHLRVAGLKLPWYKYFMVDVIGAIVVGFLVFIQLFKRVPQILFSSKTSQKKPKKKTN